MTPAGPTARSWPISQYVLKVHSRCDLACDHCYVYEHVDQSWRARPRAIGRDVVRAAAGRIADHAVAHHLPRVTVVLHGGEPLLLGASGLREVATDLRAVIEPATRLDLRMQTNGVLLTEEICELLTEVGVTVGVSLDGDQNANDRHRRFASGASSHAQVLRALQILRQPRFRDQYAGILCTIDVANDPIEVYEALRVEQPPRLDLLLPHATWDHPPARPDERTTPYADWLLAVYDRWTADGRPMPIRLFDSLRSTATGGPSGNEWVGLEPADLLVIETDGTWEKVDSLKTTYAGAAGTGFNVFHHSADTVSALPDIVRRQKGLGDLAATCRECAIVTQCGGGLFAHRYRSGSGFDNPSAYCADLKEFIVALNERMATEGTPEEQSTFAADLPDEMLIRIGSGRTDGPTVRALADAQLSLTRALLVAVADGGSAIARAGWQVLGGLDRASPAAVATVLTHPYVRVWAVDALRRFAVDRGASDYLACVAASAAIRSRAATELPVPVRGGAVTLPSLGTAIFARPVTGAARLMLTSDGCAITHEREVLRIRFDSATDWVGHAEGGAWLSNRRLAVNGGHLLVEDLDPYRDCHDWKAAERLDDASFAAWQRCLADAWSVIGRDAPDHLDALSAGLRALVPLVPDPAHQRRSSTARQAFGSVAVALADPDAVAVMIVHEYQHNILGALLDLYELYQPADRRRLRVGWRSDPRPVEGVLQGTYAHLAVADIWRRRADVSGAGSAAWEHYERYRSWTDSAVDTLLRSGALTSAGDVFVRAIAETLASWR